MAEADAFSASLVRVADEVRLTEDALPAEFLPFAEVLPVDVFLAEDALFLPEVRLLADADFRPAVFFTVVREERLRVFPARPLFDEVFFCGTAKPSIVTLVFRLRFVLLLRFFRVVLRFFVATTSPFFSFWLRFLIVYDGTRAKIVCQMIGRIE